MPIGDRPYEIGQQRSNDIVEAIDAKHLVSTNWEHITIEHCKAIIMYLSTNSNICLASARSMNTLVSQSNDLDNQNVSDLERHEKC